MRLSPLDIKKQEFSRTIRRGYDPDEVQAFLDMLAGQWDDLLAEQRRTEDKVRELKAKMGHYEKVEEALQEALRTARESSKHALDNAKQEAALIVKTATAEAEDLARDALKRRDGLLKEAGDLTARRDEIIARLRAFLGAEAELLKRFEERSTEAIAEIEEAEHPEDLALPETEVRAEEAANDVQLDVEEQEDVSPEVTEEEPVAEESVVEEPVVEEPIVEEPIVEEPVAEEPVAEEPVAEEPVAEEPVAEEPVVEEPIVEEPIAEEPIVEEPEFEESLVEEPILAEIKVEVIDETPVREIEVEVIDAMNAHGEDSASSIKSDEERADSFFQGEVPRHFSGDDEPLSFKFFESNEEDAASFLTEAEETTQFAPIPEDAARKKGHRSRSRDRSPSDSTWIVRPVVSSGQGNVADAASGAANQSDEIDKIRRILSDLD